MSDKQQMIDEDEWADRFGWSVNRGNVSNLLEDSEDVRMLLGRIGEQYVWSQQDADNGGYQIVAGMTDQAIGFYLCDRPRGPGDENIVGVIPPIEHDDDGDEPEEEGSLK